MPPKTGLRYQLFQAVGVDTTKQSVKLVQAPPIQKHEKGHFNIPVEGGLVQADLIYMRKDPKGYDYILTVVDVATRKMDAIPLRGRTGYDVIEGFEQVFKNGYISEAIDILHTDPGGEFNNKDFHEYMKDAGIEVRHSMTARKGQTGIVEYTNSLITKALGTKITSDEIEDNQAYDEYNWSELLPKIVKVLNEPGNLKVPNIRRMFDPPRTTAKELEDRLEENAVVHVKLQQPMDHMAKTNAKLTGRFRDGDIRFNKTVTHITHVVIVPDQPIRYVVAGINNASFIRKELLVATPAETEAYNAKKPKPVPTQPAVPIDLATHRGPVTRGAAKRTGTKIG